MITSTSNAKVKQIRALQGQAKRRRESGLFVVEGVRLAEEALAGGVAAEYGLYGAGLNARGMAVVQALQGAGVEMAETAEHVMAAASDTKTPQGVLLVMNIPQTRLPEYMDLCLIADGVRDPGNLGTMLRSAAAAGAQAALLPPGSADAFAPKVVRAGMGAHFRMAVASVGWDEVNQMVEHNQLKAWLAEAGGETVYTDADLRAPSAIIIGGEAEGPGNEARRMAQGRLRIPMAGESESLNAAMAAGILLFEAARQRGWPSLTSRSDA